jgi:hypothetical protein
LGYEPTSPVEAKVSLLTHSVISGEPFAVVHNSHDGSFAERRLWNERAEKEFPRPYLYTSKSTSFAP